LKGLDHYFDADKKTIESRLRWQPKEKEDGCLHEFEPRGVGAEEEESGH
jgi:hypothetical protein